MWSRAIRIKQDAKRHDRRAGPAVARDRIIDGVADHYDEVKRAMFTASAAKLTVI